MPPLPGIPYPGNTLYEDDNRRTIEIPQRTHILNANNGNKSSQCTFKVTIANFGKRYMMGVFYMAPRGGIHTQSLADLGRAPLVHTHHDPKFSQFHAFFFFLENLAKSYLAPAPDGSCPSWRNPGSVPSGDGHFTPVCMVISCRPKSHTAYLIPESVSITIRCCEWFESSVHKKHCIDAAPSIDTTQQSVSASCLHYPPY